MNKRMTPEEALDLLSNVTAQINAPREVHLQIMEAIGTLQGAITKYPEGKEGNLSS